MTDVTRRNLLLAVCATFALLSLVLGIWVYRISHSLQLIANGIVLLILIVVTWLGWKKRLHRYDE
jgi:multisubunit Na+/H+ antiporter MnhG subunit